MAGEDLERDGVDGDRGRGKRGEAMVLPPYFYDVPEQDESRGRVAWIVPFFVATNVAVLVAAMLVNDCPAHAAAGRGSCFAGFLRRFSFQPLRENPLLGPSSSTYVIMLVSGISGNVLSTLLITSGISVGSSGPLFGLLGAMLSELITNLHIHP